MTTKTLIEYLTQFPDDVEVLLSRDPEGNSYHTIQGLEAWFSYPGTNDLIDEEDAENEDNVPVVVLYPV